MDILKKFIKNVISEDSKSIPDAISNDLGLLIKGNDYILYDSAKLKQFAKESDDFITSVMQNPQQENSSQLIFGYIAILRKDPSKKRGICYGASEIKLAAAQKGWGPLMYDIVMSDTDALMPDRRSVSPSAAGVWKYYKDKRSDVEKLPFDDINNKKTPPEEDDCFLHGKEELDNAYKLNSNVNVSKLRAVHNQTAQAISKMLDISVAEVEGALESAASNFFDRVY